MSNIRIAVTNGQQIRPGNLNEALKVAGFTFDASHDAQTVIVNCADADEKPIRKVIAKHLATDWAAADAVQSNIAALEARHGMPRWARELYIAAAPDAALAAKVKATENLIATERKKL